MLKPNASKCLQLHFTCREYNQLIPGSYCIKLKNILKWDLGTIIIPKSQRKFKFRNDPKFYFIKQLRKKNVPILAEIVPNFRSDSYQS